MTGAIVSAWWGSEPPDIVLKVVDNHRAFADLHGYAHHFFVDNESSLLSSEEEIVSHWIKIPVFRELFGRGFEWVFWIDTDSIFAEPSRSLRDVVKKSKEIAFTGDCWDLCNAGHLFMRNTPRVHQFLDEWWKMRLIRFPKVMTTHVDAQGRLGDQATFNYLLAGGIADQGFVDAHGKDLFNSVNGYRGNRERKHKNFPYTHAPTTRWRIPMSRSLLAPHMKKLVTIFPQRRLNGYPVVTPGAPQANLHAPIMHYPGDMRPFLEKKLQELDSQGAEES